MTFPSGGDTQRRGLKTHRKYPARGRRFVAPHVSLESPLQGRPYGDFLRGRRVSHRHLELREYDPLLADTAMPGIDGIELAQRVNAHLPDIKLLLITGFAAVALKAQKTGANRNAKSLSKPFHLRELVQGFDRMLQDEAARRPARLPRCRRAIVALANRPRKR
tara:strand:+ start:67 stop:555 length:489 start_codon:yes stop_codon:yes gene_type:complete